jgi:hypothetical protein
MHTSKPITAVAFLIALFCLRSDEIGKGVASGDDSQTAVAQPAVEVAVDEAKKSIADGLNWLARHQNADGSWSLDKFDSCCKGGKCSGRGDMQSNIAATAMAVLPFLEAGMSSREEGPVSRGVDWLIEQQNHNGSLVNPTMYTHGLATIALCNAYQSDWSDRVQDAAQAAEKFIEESQDVKSGCWGYSPRSRVGDTSVLHWQVTALESAQAAGLTVNPETLQKAGAWLKTVSSGKHGGLFGYNRPGGTATMTACGTLSMWAIDKQARQGDARMREGIEFLIKNQPDRNHPHCYYWLPASQILQRFGGEGSQTWRQKLREMLIESQVREGCATGSWNPEKPDAVTHGKHGGRVMATSFAIQSLHACATESKQEARTDTNGPVPLFNGKDLSGWVPVNVAPKTFTVQDGIIVSTGIPTGIMRTERHYENFIIELEWRHMQPGGNAGLFIWSDALTSAGVPFSRGIEVQVLDGRESETYTSHGDVFSIHGARMKPDRPHPKGAERCLPSEKRCKPSPEWNHYRVECRDGVIQLAVNGKVVSGGSMCRPRKGYICLESEGSECHFRNIKLKELPSSSPPADEVATLDQGFRSLYTGLDLAGWKPDDGHTGHWQPKDWTLNYDGQSTAKDKNLWSEKEYGDFEMILDCRWSAKDERRHFPVMLPGVERVSFLLREPADQWRRLHIRKQPNKFTVTEISLNETVRETSQLVDVNPTRGPIGLRHDGQAIQFANIFIRELAP